MLNQKRHTSLCKGHHCHNRNSQIILPSGKPEALLSPAIMLNTTPLVSLQKGALLVSFGTSLRTVPEKRPLELFGRDFRQALCERNKDTDKE